MTQKKHKKGSLMWAMFSTLALCLLPDPARAYPNRMHLLLGNKLRQQLLSSGDYTVLLLKTPYRLTLDAQDASDILNNPFAFRAGVIGPDLTPFPLVMTDGSHARGQSPYEQCALLYQEALNSEERAYALGCLHHGAADAAVHHFVNYLAGETFTLNPIQVGRQQDYTNVVRHMVAEMIVQSAAYNAEPGSFGLSSLQLSLPKTFVVRTYQNQNSAVWQLAAANAKAKFEAVRSADPDASLIAVLQNAGLAPYEYLLLVPLYLAEFAALREQARAYVQEQIAILQDPFTPEGSQLGVGPGSDGILGSMDDDTACSIACPDIYARYFVYTGLLRPRYDAGGSELPCAFNVITAKLDLDLRQFPWALMDTIENIAVKLSQPLTPTSSDFDLSPADIEALFVPVTQWSDQITSINYDVVIHELLPDWILDLERLMQAAGININLASIIDMLLEPYLAPVREAIQDKAIGLAKSEFSKFTQTYQAMAESVKAEYQARLDLAAPDDLQGNVLDHYLDSGLFMGSMNIGTIAMAEARSVLPTQFYLWTRGPVSFDASYSLTWMQVGVCDNLRRAVFPLGMDIRGMLSVDDGILHRAVTSEDSPVECHHGSLYEFATSPSLESCVDVDLEELVADPGHRGSISRAYPPAYASDQPTCLSLAVPGIPDCVPDCRGRECGSDGCGKSCGPDCQTGYTCDPQTGGCVACAPDCTGKQCGPDGCGGICQPGCGVLGVCNEATGQCEICTPDCAGKECGPDGCEGTCGPGCGSGERCDWDTGSCVSQPGGGGCATEAGRGVSPLVLALVALTLLPRQRRPPRGGMILGLIAVLSAGFITLGCGSTGNGECRPACGGRECGPDECGGTCPPGCGGNLICNETSGRCEICLPSCSGRECGPDGCGNTCPPGCLPPEKCNQSSGQCEVCQPVCTGRECGPDQCGDTCPPGCTGNDICNQTSGQCEACQPECTGRVCGPDRCDGTCSPGCAMDESCDVLTGQCIPPGPRERLLRALGNSVWSASQTRDQVTRIYEIHFSAADGVFAEVRNPWGPSRFPKMFVFNVDDDGLTVHTIVTRPAGWPLPPDFGQTYDLTVQVIDGNPRRLQLSWAFGLEEYLEGGWPVPAEGLTAIALKFSPGGVIDNAFCNTGIGGFDYPTIFDFVNGKGAEPPVWTDLVAGVPLYEWRDDTGQNRFAITDVEGFNWNGGTVYSDQFNFFVVYRGYIDHPGGDVWMREQDDSVEDAVWAFIANGVGSSNVNDLFLEVHGFIWADGTPDEVSSYHAADLIPIQIILARCDQQIAPVTVEMSLGGYGTWQLVGDLPTIPLTGSDLFPPVF